MTQLEHFTYVRIMFNEATTQIELCEVYKELNNYCDTHNADFMNTLHLL